MMAIAAAIAQPAWAEDPLVRVHIAAKPTRDALLDLALQADVSLGGDLDACVGTTRPLSGRLALNVALTRVLDGSHCTFDRVRNGVVVIRPLVVQPPLPARSSSIPQGGALTAKSQADAAAREPEAVVSELVVTAGRKVELPGRSPTSITAISGRALQDRGHTDAEQMAADVAGMTVTNLGLGRNKVLLRGLSDGVFTGLTQSTVGLYLDDIPITYNAPDPDLRLVDVERVEVIRGPQGTLYGVGSIGGILRIVTRKPDLDTWSAEGASSVSWTQFGGPNFAAEAAINAPVIPGRLALRVAAYDEHRSGYIDDIELGLKNVNDVSRIGYRLSSRASLTPAWSLSAGLVRQSISSKDTQYEEVGLRPLQRSNAVREPHDNDFDEFYLALQGDLPWGKLTTSSARLLHQLDDRYDASPLFGRRSGSAAYDEARRVEIFVNEITLASHDGGRFQWLAGAFVSKGETALDALLRRPVKNPSPFYTEARIDQVDELALFGELTWAFTPRLSMTAGARWFDFRFHTTSSVSQARGDRDFEAKGAGSGFSPKLSVQYRLYDRATVYAQVAKGYRAGGFNTSGLIGQNFDRRINNPARRYDPDELWSLETGAKMTFWRERLQLRMAVFYALWRNIQTDQFLPSGLPYTANAGNGVNGGLELEATMRPRAHWEVRLAGLIDNPHLTEASPAFASRTDAGLPGVPSGSGSFGVSFDRPLVSGRTLRVETAIGYVGQSHLTFDAQHLYTMGGYANANLSLALDGPRARTTLFIDNVFDGQGNTFAFGDPFRINRSVEATPLRPRTVGIRLAAKL